MGSYWFLMSFPSRVIEIFVGKVLIFFVLFFLFPLDFGLYLRGCVRLFKPFFLYFFFFVEELFSCHFYEFGFVLGWFALVFNAFAFSSLFGLLHYLCFFVMLSLMLNILPISFLAVVGLGLLAYIGNGLLELFLPCFRFVFSCFLKRFFCYSNVPLFLSFLSR